MNLWRKWRKRTWNERRLLLEAAWWVAFFAAAIQVAPFERIARQIGMTPRAGATREEEERSAPVAAQIGWAVAAVAARTPWTSTCLAQALAAGVMLHRRGLASELTLGVLRSSDSITALEAHAWLQQGGHFVTGERCHERFTPVSVFVLPASRQP